MAKKLEEMSLEELRVAYTELMSEKEKSDNSITTLTEQNTKLTEDNNKLRHYNNELFAKIPNLNHVTSDDKDKPQEQTYEKLFDDINKEGGLF